MYMYHNDFKACEKKVNPADSLEFSTFYSSHTV